MFDKFDFFLGCQILARDQIRYGTYGKTERMFRLSINTIQIVKIHNLTCGNPDDVVLLSTLDRGIIGLRGVYSGESES